MFFNFALLHKVGLNQQAFSVKEQGVNMSRHIVSVTIALLL